MNPYGTGAGLEVVVTNSGFGLGSYYNRAIGPSTSLFAELSIGSEKNEREVKFIGFGQNFIPDKANYFLRMPLRVGIQHRLWEDYIEENFRPFFQIAAGPTVGWMYPYFDDANGNGTYEGDERRYSGIGSIFQGEWRVGFGGVIGLGAHFGNSQRLTQGVRIGYIFNYFTEDIQLLEPDEESPSQRFFGTPTITIVFGRLFPPKSARR